MAGKLYELAPVGFKLPFYTDDKNRLQTRAADRLPWISWPDGSWCLQANLYMLELLRRGLSTRERGGTLATYAAGLTHLLRFCWERKREFHDLTDRDFTTLITNLTTELNPKNPSERARDANRVIDIGRVCLDFLDVYARHTADQALVGQDGRIRCERKTAQLKVKTRQGRAKELKREFWHHASFPTPDPARRRAPISSEAIKSLRKAAIERPGSAHLRKRSLTVIKLLEMLGGRVGEVALLTVKSVREALAMEQPMIKLQTLKTRKDEHRLVPVHPHDLRVVLEYIEVNRARVVRDTLGRQADHDFVLVGETSGQPLRSGTITREINTLARFAGLRQKTCAHMFRHRFITKVFVALIEEHAYTNSDELRRALLDTESIKRKVMEWTGHRNIDSLEPYIHLAFDEVTNFRRTQNAVTARLAVESFAGTVDETLMELRAIAGTGASERIISSFADKLTLLSAQLRGLEPA